MSKYSTSKFEKTSLILEQFLIDIEKRAVFSYTKNCSGGYVVKHKIVNYSLTIDFFFAQILQATWIQDYLIPYQILSENI